MSEGTVSLCQRVQSACVRGYSQLVSEGTVSLCQRVQSVCLRGYSQFVSESIVSLWQKVQSVCVRGYSQFVCCLNAHSIAQYTIASFSWQDNKVI